MKKSLFAAFVLLSMQGQAQLFEMKKTYTGFHYAFSHFNEKGINQFVVQFNQLYQKDLKTGFHQYKGNERGQTFTTSGFRVIFGKKDTKFTASSDYAYGWGKEKNQAEFNNGIVQHMDMLFRCNQINFSFGITKNNNKLWLEGLYCTNLGKTIIKFSTEEPNGVRSYGTEYRLNGVYTGTIKTMEFGCQISYKWRKKYVLYARALLPAITMGPGTNERNFVDDKSSQSDPKDFPSDYNTYVSDPSHMSGKQFLQSTNFKGFSYGFGMFYLIGKSK